MLRPGWAGTLPWTPDGAGRLGLPSQVNDDGGVFGRKIQLQAFDDSYDPDRATACFKRMTKEGVFALGFFVGTPTAKVYVPLAEEEKIPVVGLFTGANCCTNL
jgi:branched-chain amino acid transport system substrate-binding protein